MDAKPREAVCRLCGKKARFIPTKSGDFQVCTNSDCLLFGIDEVAHFPEEE